MKWKGVITIKFRWIDEEGKVFYKGIGIKCVNYKSTEGIGETIRTTRLRDNIPDFAECYVYGLRARLEKLESANALEYILRFHDASYYIQTKEEKHK